MYLEVAHNGFILLLLLKQKVHLTVKIKFECARRCYYCLSGVLLIFE